MAVVRIGQDGSVQIFGCWGGNSKMRKFLPTDETTADILWRELGIEIVDIMSRINSISRPFSGEDADFTLMDSQGEYFQVSGKFFLGDSMALFRV